MNNIKFTDEWGEICPIFLDHENTFEQIGSGILIEIFNNTYLLTAAHVIDEMKFNTNSELHIPTKDGFHHISGILYHVNIDEKKLRNTDNIDFSFYKLSKEMVNNLHEGLIPLTENQLLFEKEFTFEYNFNSANILPPRKMPKIMRKIYNNETKINTEQIKKLNEKICEITITFAGYPVTKSKSRNKIYQSEIVYYHGKALTENEYKTNNYDKSLNILAEHGKYGSMDKNLLSSNSPKPYGISGGGIYKIHKTQNGFDRKLIGIGHTYKSKKHLFVGTNIKFCIEMIYKVLMDNNFTQ